MSQYYAHAHKFRFHVFTYRKGKKTSTSKINRKGNNNNAEEGNKVDSDDEDDDDDGNNDTKGKDDDDDDDDDDVDNENRNQVDAPNGNHCGVSAPKFVFNAENMRTANAVHGSGDLMNIIHSPIVDSLRGVSRYHVTLPARPKPFWQNGPPVQTVLMYQWSAVHGKGSDFPEFIKTFSTKDIRKEQHGSNLLKRSRNNSCSSVFGFSTTIPTSKKDTIKEHVTECLTFIYEVMYDYSQQDGAKYALDYIHDNSKVDENGNIGGLYGALTRNKPDTSSVELKMKKELCLYWKKTFQIVEDVPLDKYWTDVDIKEMLEEFLGANNWNMVPKDVRKACYKHNWRMKSLPAWNEIVRERYYPLSG